MFSEYFETDKPIDDIVKKEDETKKDNKVNTDNFDNKKNSKEKKEQDLQAEETTAKINGRINFLKNDDPNSANLKEKQYTLSSAISESMEAWIWQIDEKKIPWFEKILPDGSKAKVVCSNNSFVLSITKESTTWRKEYLNINLSNFQNNENNVKNNENNKKENTIPKMTITWNIKLLDNNLVWWMSESPVWDNINLSIWDQYDIVKIVNSIEENVMRLEREDAHWNYQVQMEKKEQESKKIDDFRLFLCELQFDPQKDNEEMLKYLRNPENFNDNDNLDYRNIVEWLCILCRHNTMEEIIKILDLPIQEQAEKLKESTFSSWEFVIEYLMTASDSSVSLIIKNKDQIVKLSQQEW